MKAWKGFKPGPDGTLVCEGIGYSKTYRDGETYTEPSAVLCSRGMHACTEPLDVFGYYPPATSVYREVEVGDDARGESDGDSKVVTTQMTVGVEVSVMGMVKVGLSILWERISRVQDEAQIKALAARKSATGEVSSGDRGTAAASGDRGTAAASGNQGTAAASGNRGTAAVSGPHSVAAATGYDGRAKGVCGCVLLLIERADWSEDYRIIGHKSVMVGKKCQGSVVKPDTWYALRGGRVVEVDDTGKAVSK